MSGERLSAAVELVLKLIQIRFRTPAEEFELLRAHFSCEPSVIKAFDDSENSWEDVTNASLSYLLKSALGKPSANKGSQGATSNVNTGNSVIKAVADVEKLKQSITQVCEKISKG